MPTDPKKTGVSIAIPTYNRAALLAHTLESVAQLRIPDGADAEVVVIDNNCTDDTAAVVERAAAGSPLPVRRVLELQQGLCYGRNRALREARHEHLIYLDDDIEVAADWLSGYFDAVERFDADCVVGPVAPRFDGPVPPHFTQRVLDSIGSGYSRKGDQPLLLPPEQAHEVPGCNFGVRKQAALAVGGFDNGLDRAGKGLLAGGDWEFGMRLVRARRRVAYHPRCAIVHVITAEKLNSRYMRRRWYGLGATRRAIDARYDRRLSFRRRLRFVRRAAGLLSRALCLYCLARTGNAFQRELEAWQALGYLRGSG